MAKRNNKMLPRTFAVMLSVNVMASLLSVPALLPGKCRGDYNCPDYRNLHRARRQRQRRK